MEFSNAGHNPPVMLRRAENPEFLSSTGSLPIAIFEDTPYIRETLPLEKGDTILIYSDGVTEAMNKEQALFSDERLLQSLREVKGKPSDGLLKKILADVHGYAAGTPQSDDITILAIQFRGPQDTSIEAGRIENAKSGE